MARGSTSLKKRDRELKTQMKRMEKASMKRLVKAAAKAAILLGVLSFPMAAKAQGVPGGWRLASSGSLTSCYSFTPQVVVPQPSGASINRQVGRIEAASTASGPLIIMAFASAAATPSGLTPALVHVCEGTPDCVAEPPKGASFSFVHGLLVCANNPTATDPAVYSTGGGADLSILYQ